MKNRLPIKLGRKLPNCPRRYWQIFHVISKFARSNIRVLTILITVLHSTNRSKLSYIRYFWFLLNLIFLKSCSIFFKFSISINTLIICHLMKHSPSPKLHLLKNPSPPQAYPEACRSKNPKFYKESNEYYHVRAEHYVI